MFTSNRFLFEFMHSLHVLNRNVDMIKQINKQQRQATKCNSIYLFQSLLNTGYQKGTCVKVRGAYKGSAIISRINYK